MVKIQVRRSKVDGTVRCPSSKSYTHRALAIASLAADGQSRITNGLLARDTLATLACCRALGAEVQEGKRGVVQVQGRHDFPPPENVLNCENSGTTIRIMTAMSGLVRSGHVILTGDESLRRRPMQPILDALGPLGVEAYSTKGNGTPPLVVRGGGIKGGTTVIDGSISSQFISGLLIAGIYADSEIVLKIKGDLVSKPYVRATMATMEQFGVKIDHEPSMLEYHIMQAEYKPTEFDVPSDFSTAALILSAGALVGKRLKVKGLNFNLPQGDSQIVEIMKQMDCAIKADRSRGEVVVEGTESLEGGEFNLADTPDLLPVVSILALKARSPVKITGVAHARVKETDRVANIAHELAKFGAKVDEFHDGLTIAAPKKLKNASLEAYNDHRLFMAFSIASMMTEKSVVEGAESVDVSYPHFVQDMKGLGARLSPAR
ncbi:3-phosphoshikimate 1-carboxyvinyltransferase [Nitrososphaera viennensis]|uniref:3-phosphoshikimate 1-carboxyvinyltransferase n=2 Tax=Nitrososphaera viennensis TaxID=1034015 RepID=A0A060HNJ7_9ARCH|nr:3-phosphoshikimate 1-carboxyvinyltransferase [Nitrososphaera viennensis]AIC14777.1 3-phosphoshikimate 1-carboxyvinyltransferase [Nitrososphaera viennensis EN76]UVS69732.1 3-phosphoshikimate 1-carboxyvinyltransferase [Nitrososphaera viennensis]